MNWPFALVASSLLMTCAPATEPATGAPRCRGPAMGHLKVTEGYREVTREALARWEKLVPGLRVWVSVVEHGEENVVFLPTDSIHQGTTLLGGPTPIIIVRATELDRLTVLTHELGHALTAGGCEHPERGSLMVATIEPGTTPDINDEDLSCFTRGLLCAY